MDIEKEIKDVLTNYRIEKQLDNIKDLLIKKDLEQYTSSSSLGFWVFALLAMIGYGGFGSNMPNITNIYTNEKEVKNNESSI